MTTIIINGIEPADGQNILLIPPSHFSEADGFHLNRALLEIFPTTNFVILTGGFQVLTGPSGEVNAYTVEDEDE